jgi:acylphosphatase
MNPLMGSVLAQVASIKQIIVVQEALQRGLQIHGWIYDVGNGHIKVVGNMEQPQFTPVTSVPQTERIVPHKVEVSKSDMTIQEKLVKLVMWRFWP